MIRRILQQPHAVLVGVLIVTVLGLLSLRRLPPDLLPTFQTPAVQVVTFYPGMPPEVMERDIMSRLERWTGQSVGIEHQEAKAMLGVSVVKNYFREDISLDAAMSQTTSYAVSDMFYLPPGTIPPMVMPFDPTASVPLCLITVSSDTMSEKELYDIAYFELRNRLQSIEGVIAPAVYGGKLRRILAYLDREKLAARGLTPMDVVDALGRQSVFVPAGNIKAGETDYQVFADAMPERVEELDDIPIAKRDGQLVYLRDVASAQDSAQIQSNVVRINGRRQVYIPIYRQPGANTIAVVDAIRSRLDQVGNRLREMDSRAADLVLEVSLDQSVFVRESLDDLRLAGLLGALLSGLVVAVFLRSLRATLIVVLAIPISILCAFTGLFYTGQTLNAMTLGGLALAVGILVDQSIVVLENIVEHQRRGKDPVLAAIEGTAEVAGPVVVSALTFAVVFYPVVFLSGMAGFLFTPLAIATTVAIAASLAVALVVIPGYCARFRKAPVVGSEAERRSLRAYAGVVRAALRHRRIVVALAFAAAAASVGALAGVGTEGVGTELFPRVDSGQFQILVRLPSGTRIEHTERKVAQIENVIIDELGVAGHPDSQLKIVISNIGVLMDWPAAYTPNTGSMDAFLLVQLEERPGQPDVFSVVERLRTRLSAEFPDVEFAFDTGGMLTAALNFGEPAPIHFQVSGSDLRVLGELAGRVARILTTIEGAVDVRVAQRLDYPTIMIDIDREKAALAGVSVERLMQDLVTATNSSINFRPEFWLDPKNGNHYFIGAQYPEHELVDTDTIADIPLPAEGGLTVPLRTVATISRGTGPSLVNHHNITRVFDIYAGVGRGSNIGKVVTAMEAALAADAALGLATEGGDTWAIEGETYADRGYTLRAAGEVQTMRSSFEQFALGLGIAVLLVYLLMVAQFKGFVDPLVVMFTVPLAVIGIAITLLGTDTALSIQSFMGMIMVVGIVVEYGIILVHFANQRMAEGRSKLDAIVDAATMRVRPILMTSLTTVFALLPMAIGHGGGETNVPLARTIVGGVVAATALTLFVLPCLYAMMKREPRASQLEVAG